MWTDTMKTLITPAEVVALAFGTSNSIRAQQVSEATIVAAQRKYLLPVLGSTLLDDLLYGFYGEEVIEPLKMALALYVKRLMLPALAAQVGMAGVVRYVGEGYTDVDAVTFGRLLTRTKADADAVLDAVVDIMETNPDLYPSYDAAENVRHRINIASKVIL